jgi:hypothetical protein
MLDESGIDTVAENIGKIKLSFASLLQLQKNRNTIEKNRIYCFMEYKI